MRKALKKYTIIYLTFNVLLLIIYRYYFYDKSAFFSEENMAASIGIVNETLDWLIDFLRKKPALQKPFLNVFDTNKIIVKGFRYQKDRLLTSDNNISVKEVDIILKKYNNPLLDLKECHDTTFYNTQKATKLRDNEVKAIIAKFKQYAVEDLRI